MKAVVYVVMDFDTIKGVWKSKKKADSHAKEFDMGYVIKEEVRN